MHVKVLFCSNKIKLFIKQLLYLEINDTSHILPEIDSAYLALLLQLEQLNSCLA